MQAHGAFSSTEVQGDFLTDVAKPLSPDTCEHMTALGMCQILSLRNADSL